MQKRQTQIISEISIVPIKPKFGHIAFASFLLFECFYVCSVAVYTRPGGGIRLVFPRKKNLDICHPTKHELYQMAESEIFDEMVVHGLI